MTSSPERRALVARDHPGRRDLRLAGGAAPRRRRGGRHLHPGRHPQPRSPTGRSTSGWPSSATSRSRSTPRPPARSVELAERLGLPLSPYQNRRWDSDFLTVRALADRRRARRADPVRVAVRAVRPRPRPARRRAAARCCDFGSHLVDQALVLLGPVAVGLRRVAAARERSRRRRLRRADPRRRRALAPVGQLEPGRAGPAVPGHRDDRAATSSAAPMDGQEDALLAGQTPATLGADWGAEPADAGAGCPAATTARRCRRSAARGTPSTRRSRPPSAGTGPCRSTPRDAVATATVLDAARRSATDGVVVPLG